MCAMCDLTTTLVLGRHRFALEARRAAFLKAMIQYWTTPNEQGHLGDYLTAAGFTLVEIKDHGPSGILAMEALKELGIVPEEPA